MRSIVKRTGCILAVGAVAVCGVGRASAEPEASVVGFDPVVRYNVSGEVAEIVSATPDGETLVYTDSIVEEVGFVDITDTTTPTELGTVPLSGSPTAVSVTPDGAWTLVVVAGSNELVIVDVATRAIEHTIALGGQPDSVAIQRNGRYAAIAIENERDEDVSSGAMPQLPAGSLIIVDLVGAPTAGTTRTVAMTGLADRFPEDPEPEFVDIRSGIVAVTLQENNHIVLVRLSDGSVVRYLPAGTTTHAADLTDNGTVSFTETLTSARREPDAVGPSPSSAPSGATSWPSTA